MSDKSDILVLGATGYTGAYITRYLAAHPQRNSFSLALGARSPQKLQTLVEELNLGTSVQLVYVDVTKPDEVDAAVKTTRVVINAVGPYWLWGTPVVRSCVRNGVHYVDLTGERAWIKLIINEFDYYATKTGSIIVPACGFDSVPSDVSAYLANKTLKALGPSPTTGVHLSAGSCTSGFRVSGGVSGGTIASALTSLDQVPKALARQSRMGWFLSPWVGLNRAPFRFIYNLPVPGEKTIKGGIFFMAFTNKGIVERSFGLLEYQKMSKVIDAAQAVIQSYGPHFAYDEFMVTSGTMSAFVLTATLIFGFSMMLIRPVRNFAKRFLPQSGDGPTDEQMQKGFFKLTNITTSDSSPPVQVKTVMKGNGDPGYLLTPIMIVESALCILLPPVSQTRDSTKKDNIHALPAFAQQGGVLTPMTAFGDALIQRLEESGRFEISSSVVDTGLGKKQD